MTQDLRGLPLRSHLFLRPSAQGQGPSLLLIDQCHGHEIRRVSQHQISKATILTESSPR